MQNSPRITQLKLANKLIMVEDSGKQYQEEKYKFGKYFDPYTTNGGWVPEHKKVEEFDQLRDIARDFFNV